MLNDEIREAINDNKLPREKLRELVYRGDVTTLLQDGLNKVLEGITTFEEIYKNVAIDTVLDEKYDPEDFNSIIENIEENKEIQNEEIIENITPLNESPKNDNDVEEII